MFFARKSRADKYCYQTVKMISILYHGTPSFESLALAREGPRRSRCRPPQSHLEEHLFRFLSQVQLEFAHHDRP
jgi:hypothetical protein